MIDKDRPSFSKGAIVCEKETGFYFEVDGSTLKNRSVGGSPKRKMLIPTRYIVCKKISGLDYEDRFSNINSEQIEFLPRELKIVKIKIVDAAANMVNERENSVKCNLVGFNSKVTD